MKEEVFREYYNQYVDMIYRITYTYFNGNSSDMEDIIQDVFLKLYEKNPTFNSWDHAKAWLIRVTTNMCKNKVAHWWNKKVSIDKIIEPMDELKDNTVLNAILNLPVNQKLSIYLHYYEGYSAKEISEMLNKNENTIFGYLHQGRELLKKELGDGFDE